MAKSQDYLPQIIKPLIIVEWEIHIISIINSVGVMPIF